MQDDKSSILIHKNHPNSIGNSVKLTHDLYFLPVDVIENIEVNIIFCPIDKVIDNYSSKLAKVSLFKN